MILNCKSYSITGISKLEKISKLIKLDLSKQNYISHVYIPICFLNITIVVNISGNEETFAEYACQISNPIEGLVVLCQLGEEMQFREKRVRSFHRSRYCNCTELQFTSSISWNLSFVYLQYHPDEFRSRNNTICSRDVILFVLFVKCLFYSAIFPQNVPRSYFQAFRDHFAKTGKENLYFRFQGEKSKFQTYVTYQNRTRVGHSYENFSLSNEICIFNSVARVASLRC